MEQADGQGLGDVLGRRGRVHKVEVVCVCVYSQSIQLGTDPDFFRFDPLF